MKDYTHVFAMMPVEAFMDHRLSLIQLRILGALYTWRDKNTNVAQVYRFQIADRCGYSDRTISEHTTKLQALGWLKKIGEGGRGVQSKYQVTVPELGTVSDSKTVPEVGTVPDPALKRFPIRRKNGSRTENTLQNNYRLSTDLEGATAPPPKKQKRKQQLPEGFSPTQKHQELATSLGVDLSQEFEQFKDYHGAKGTTMLNWDLAFNTWLRRANKFQRGNSNAASKQFHNESAFERGKRKRAEIERALDQESEPRLGQDAGNVRLNVG
ncbi:MAG TPA: hypothetical protein VFP95_07215 [Gammaproteobacteria bacterium]|nr:hypothetical protein [Gammaproteobacteria bacterium]